MTATWSRIEPMDEDESMRMLQSVRWGRCAWSGPAGPRILPVNHAVVDGNVVFRTGLHGTLADATDAADGSPVAFEVDELDDRLAWGWSVVVLGRAEQVQDHTEVEALFRRLPQPWATGLRPVLVRIVPTEVTGRRFSKS